MLNGLLAVINSSFNDLNKRHNSLIKLFFHFSRSPIILCELDSEKNLGGQS